jgi:acyl-[acyl-carrier-protein]-phospholipid O-acyltransferase/long-chain-fatty-acid--[acyl-carrier-protein] ligase
MGKSTNRRKTKKRELFTNGFISLIGVSFFGAANDNILKQILTLMVVAGGLWANRLGAGTQGIISLVLTVPFIFLSGYAGQIADKFSKQRVILWVKIAEIPIALIALLGLLLGSFWLSLFALLLLAIQSSFYGPAKFGVIPEVVDSHRLSQANGLLNAISNVAVILGSLAAGPLADLYYPTIRNDELIESVATIEPAELSNELAAQVSDAEAAEEIVLVADPSRQPSRLPIGLAMVGVSLIGLTTAFLMPRMKPVDPVLKLSGDFFRPHIQTFQDANRPLLVVMFSWSGFYLIGALALLMFPDYRSILGVSNTAITNLIGLLAVAVVVGSCTVGVLSGKSIRPYFALVGAIGMTICFGIMGFATMTYLSLAILVFCVGFFAGFYIVPLQSLLQFLSPADERGRFFGTANALSFVFISAAGVIYFGLASFGMPAERIPLVCAGFATIGTMVGALELRRIMAAQKSRRILLDIKEEAESET